MTAAAIPPVEIPPHAAWCEEHRKLYRGACPWCSVGAMGGRMPLEDGENNRWRAPGEERWLEGAERDGGRFRRAAGPRRRHVPRRPEHVAKYEEAKRLREAHPELSGWQIAKRLGVAVSTLHGWAL